MNSQMTRTLSAGKPSSSATHRARPRCTASRCRRSACRRPIRTPPGASPSSCAVRPRCGTSLRPRRRPQRAPLVGAALVLDRIGGELLPLDRDRGDRHPSSSSHSTTIPSTAARPIERVGRDRRDRGAGDNRAPPRAHSPRRDRARRARRVARAPARDRWRHARMRVRRAQNRRVEHPGSSTSAV